MGVIPLEVGAAAVEEEEVVLLGQLLEEVGLVDVLVFYLSVVLEVSYFVVAVVEAEVVLPLVGRYALFEAAVSVCSKLEADFY